MFEPLSKVEIAPAIRIGNDEELLVELKLLWTILNAIGTLWGRLHLAARSAPGQQAPSSMCRCVRSWLKPSLLSLLRWSSVRVSEKFCVSKKEEETFGNADRSRNFVFPLRKGCEVDVLVGLTRLDFERVRKASLWTNIL